MISTKEKIWNIELVVEDIKCFPQTYKTILKELVNDGTAQLILRRKLNKLHKNGTICKTNIPGTRFGKSIFYAFEKKYYIVIEAGRLGSKVYIFFKYKRLGTKKLYIKIKNFWILHKGEWLEKNEEIVLFEGNILKFI